MSGTVLGEGYRVSTKPSWVSGLVGQAEPPDFQSRTVLQSHDY